MSEEEEFPWEQNGLLVFYTHGDTKDGKRRLKIQYRDATVFLEYEEEGEGLKAIQDHLDRVRKYYFDAYDAMLDAEENLDDELIELLGGDPDDE